MHNEPSRRYVLRDLPGVAALEERLAGIEAHPFPQWAAGCEGLREHADRLSLALFGIVDADTVFRAGNDEEEGDDAEAETYEEAVALWERWEQNFALLGPWSVFSWEVEPGFEGWCLPEPDAAQIVFDAMGWDVRDAHGMPMRAVAVLGRSIIAATKGLRGSLPDASREPTPQALSAWETQLQRDAERFRRRRVA